MTTSTRGSRWRWRGCGRRRRSVVDLAETDAVRELLDGLTKNLDGAAAATAIGRKRAVVHNLLGYAVERGMLAANPVAQVTWRRPKRVEQVDPRVVINPRQARELLSALTYVGRRDVARGAHLVGFFGGIYYSAARPAEMVNVRETDCKLPDKGWGELTLWESRPGGRLALDRHRSCARPAGVEAPRGERGAAGAHPAGPGRAAAGAYRAVRGRR